MEAAASAVGWLTSQHRMCVIRPNMRHIRILARYAFKMMSSSKAGAAAARPECTCG
jgi:hypothetical protein